MGVSLTSAGLVACAGWGYFSSLLRRGTCPIAHGKVSLILDNLRVHHSKPVKAWVDERKDKIELFYLPSNSPELNPEERLNADLKQALYTKVPVRTKAKLKTAATEHMQALGKSSGRVRKFFQDARVKHAA
jgi:transposase